MVDDFRDGKSLLFKESYVIIKALTTAEKTDLIYYCLGNIESLARMNAFYENLGKGKRID